MKSRFARLAAVTIGLLAIAVCGFQQIVKISALPPIGALHADDMMVDVDTHDQSGGTAGTTKRLTVAQLFGGPSSGQLVGWASTATPVTIGSGLQLSNNMLTATGGGGGGGGSGTVTTVSVATANGLAGSVANATTTPAITLSTTATGVLKGNGTAISAATAGTDYQAPITLSTTGSSGAATFSGNTLNIPVYTGGGSGTPGGSTGQFQYNNSGAFGGSANLTLSSNSLANFTAVADPGTFVGGDLWLSSASNGLAFSPVPALSQRMGGIIYRSGTCTAVSNTTSSTSLLSSPSWSTGSLTVPVSKLVPGTTFLIRPIMVYSTTGTPAFYARVFVNGTVVLGAEATATMPSNITTLGIQSLGGLQVVVDTVSGGANTTIGFVGIGSLCIHNNSATPIILPSEAGLPSDISVTNSGNITIDYQCTWGTAASGNTVQIRYFEVMMF